MIEISFKSRSSSCFCPCACPNAGGLLSQVSFSLQFAEAKPNPKTNNKNKRKKPKLQFCSVYYKPFPRVQWHQCFNFMDSKAAFEGLFGRETRFYGVMVSTSDSESGDPSSNLGRT